MTDEPLPRIAPAAHVVELSYATPTREDARPGFLTVIAILSVAIGTISAAGYGLRLIRWLIRLTSISNAATGAHGPVTPPMIFRMALVVIGLTAAVLLVAGGLQLFRDKHVARRLHLAFAGIKLALTTFETIVSFLMWSPTPIYSEIVLLNLVAAAIICAYPITLIVALRRPRAKAYFAIRAAL